MPFNIGPGELIIILIIALIVVGPGKLPDVGSALGRSLREFRKAASDVKESTSLDAPAATAATAAATPAPAPAPAPAPDVPAVPTAPMPAAAVVEAGPPPAAPAAPVAAAEALPADAGTAGTEPAQAQPVAAAVAAEADEQPSA
jgi:TatA/E family protein of Tat protein translocase